MIVRPDGVASGPTASYRCPNLVRPLTIHAGMEGMLAQSLGKRPASSLGSKTMLTE